MRGTTRGPLPARVYWVRRLMVLGIATLLVVGIAQLLAGSGNGSSGADRATPAAQTSPQMSLSTGPEGPTDGPAGGSTHHAQDTTSAAPMVMPSGPCAANDVAVTPSVPSPVAGRDISLVLDFSAITSPACDWTMSGRTLALRITSGADLIWTTVQCARTIPTQALVLRNTQLTRVRLTWDARWSEPGCPQLTQWALPGTYHLHVAALGGQPQETTFLLTAPTAPQVTRTPHPGKKHHHHHHRAG